MAALVGNSIHGEAGLGETVNASGSVTFSTMVGQATAAGTAELAAPSGDYGNLVVIDHGFGLVTRYGHMSKFAVWQGQQVQRGDIIREINRQRDNAQKALAARFDRKAFNDTIVLGGNVPLDVLAKNVEEYIRMDKASIG